MSIYIFTAIVFFFLSLSTYNLNPRSERVKKVLALSILWLILYEGLRWEIGTDWDSYYADFVNLDVSGHIEFGYFVLMKIVRFFTSSYSLFLLLITTFFYISLSKYVVKYSTAPLMSLCIYYCLMVGLMGCNRQLIALFICLLSLDFAFKKELKYFLICIFVAFSFHTTSIIFVAAYYIINKNLSNKTILVFIGLSLAIGYLGIIDRIPYVGYLNFLDDKSVEKLATYSEGVGSAYSFIGTFKRLLIAIPCLFMRRHLADSVTDAMIKLYLFGAMIYFAFNGSVLELMAGRGALYYSIAEIIVVPFLIKRFIRDKNMKYLVWLAYFSFLLYTMNRDMDYYFSSIGVDIFRPYKCIFF